MKEDALNRSLGPRRILAIILTVTNYLEKSAHMCVLKYLARRGWDVTVLTVDRTGHEESFEENWCGVKIVRISPQSWGWRMMQPLYRARRTGRNTRLGAVLAKVCNRMLLPVTFTCSFPDQFVRARRELLRHAFRLHRDRQFDLVASLYHPLTAHWVARSFARETGASWVALTKDFYSWPDELAQWAGGELINGVKRRYESRLMRGCPLLLTVSDTMTAYYRRVFPQLNTQTLAHCFDEEVFSSQVEVDTASDTFRLVWVGVITKHDEAALGDLFEVVSQLFREGRIDSKHFRLRFVGHGLYVVNALAQKYQCSELLETRDTVPHEEAIREVCRATCLFIKRHEWDAKRRLTEHIGSCRPILAYPTYPGHMTNAVLAQYGAARIADDKQQLKVAVREIYKEFLRNGKLDWPVDRQLVQRQTARQRAAELEALLINQISSSSFAPDR